MSAARAAREIEEGRLTSEALVQACLQRIREREPQIGAWACYDAESALRQARALDRMAPGLRGPLHGIPVGVKDVLDTADMPTTYNSPIYQGHRPAWDAACVAATRHAGGIVLGKTMATEFANNHPAPTRNPRDLQRSPGGSSSGSAAAVADFMVPLAIGTQTGGSIIRPAAFCGVVGYKPTFGAINRAGLKAVAESVDTIGVIARSVEDAALFIHAVSGRRLPDFDDQPPPPRIGFCRSPYWEHADEATRNLLETSASRLARAGAKVRDFALPPEVASLYTEQDAIVYFETARALAYEFHRFPGKISAALSGRLEQGWRYSCEDYDAAQRHAEAARIMLAAQMEGYDILLTPSAHGEAPRWRQPIGDSLFNKNWTLLGLPCVTIPCGTGPSRLPLGVQIVGPRHADARTLRYAHWVWQRLG